MTNQFVKGAREGQVERIDKVAMVRSSKGGGNTAWLCDLYPVVLGLWG